MKRRKLVKKCSRCDKTKPIRCFYPSSACRDCTAVITDEWRAKRKASKAV